MVELVFSLRAFLPLRSHHVPPPPPSHHLSRSPPPSPVRAPAHSAHPYSRGLFTHLFPPPRAGRQSTPSKIIFPIYPAHTTNPHHHPLPFPPSSSLHLLGATACSLPLSTAFPPSLPVSSLHPPLAPFPASLLTAPRLVLFCRNDKTPGGRVSGHNRGNWLFMAQFRV